MLSRIFSRAHHALPAVRKLAPAFTAPAIVNGATKMVSLADYAGKYVVLFWYPLDFTFVCPTEITAFSDRAGDFRAINAEVVGISIDSTFSHLAWINTPRNKGGLGAMSIPLIGDISKTVSNAYGMVVEDPSDDMHGVTLRGTVIISPAGKVVHVSNTDAPVGRSVDEVLRLIQAFRAWLGRERRLCKTAIYLFIYRLPPHPSLLQSSSRKTARCAPRAGRRARRR